MSSIRSDVMNQLGSMGLTARYESMKQQALHTNPEARAMTPEEVDRFTAHAAEKFGNCKALDNSAIDRDKAPGTLEVAYGEGKIVGRYGGRSQGYESFSTNATVPEYAIESGEQNIGFIAGISLVSDGTTTQATQFRINRLNPEENLIWNFAG
jgi:hypothetical protein